MFTKTALKKYINDYIVECDKLGVHFKKVILFGSYARNMPHKWSDIDLALVSDNFTGMVLDDIKKIALASVKFVDIEPHTYNTAYFEESDPFIEEIKNTGKEIKLKSILL